MKVHGNTSCCPPYVAKDSFYSLFPCYKTKGLSQSSKENYCGDLTFPICFTKITFTVRTICKIRSITEYKILSTSI